ncbi:hypothetical protein LMH73_004525 [Vibrio splendidus]|nr:hypothetical protein [Vibrio splendidus]MCC4883256.1 hypothetical protein [Vibrio splendidus]
MSSITKKINKLQAMVDDELSNTPLMQPSELRRDIRRFRLVVFTFVTASYLALILLTYENVSLLGKHEQDYYLSTYSGFVYEIEDCEKQLCSGTLRSKE